MVKTVTIDGQEYIAKEDFIESNTSAEGIYKYLVGKPAIIRNCVGGVHFGIVLAADSTGVVLQNARRMWYHEPKDLSKSSWYEGVARDGLGSNSKVSVTMPHVILSEDYLALPLSKDRYDDLMEQTPHVN